MDRFGQRTPHKFPHSGFLRVRLYTAPQCPDVAAGAMIGRGTGKGPRPKETPAGGLKEVVGARARTMQSTALASGGYQPIAHRQPQDFVRRRGRQMEAERGAVSR
ncbi:MAG: hypothetical protein NTY01_04010, partial [Verrucomicrobia bacterium]|nr:hypothetical protein [Verrucomicrobiota bacterium]